MQKDCENESLLLASHRSRLSQHCIHCHRALWAATLAQHNARLDWWVCLTLCQCEKVEGESRHTGIGTKSALLFPRARGQTRTADLQRHPPMLYRLSYTRATLRSLQRRSYMELQSIFFAENIFLLIFIAEMSIKMFALGPSIYFMSSFNRFDCMVIGAR